MVGSLVFSLQWEVGSLKFLRKWLLITNRVREDVPRDWRATCGTRARKKTTTHVPYVEPIWRLLKAGDVPSTQHHFISRFIWFMLNALGIQHSTNMCRKRHSKSRVSLSPVRRQLHSIWRKDRDACPRKYFLEMNYSEYVPCLYYIIQHMTWFICHGFNMYQFYSILSIWRHGMYSWTVVNELWSARGS